MWFGDPSWVIRSTFQGPVEDFSRLEACAESNAFLAPRLRQSSRFLNPEGDLSTEATLSGTSSKIARTFEKCWDTVKGEMSQRANVPVDLNKTADTTVKNP